MVYSIIAKPKAKVEHLVNWYFGNFCYRCARIDNPNERYGRNCYDKMQKIKNTLEVQEMTHKQFREIIKGSLFCGPIKRKSERCQICEKLGIPQRGF